MCKWYIQFANVILVVRILHAKGIGKGPRWRWPRLVNMANLHYHPNLRFWKVIKKP